MWTVALALAILGSTAACGVPREFERRDLVKTAITNVHVWDGGKFPSTKSTVVFINGRLANALPIGATVIDGKGGYLLPGFIDSHCHITSCSYLDAMRQYGVTTALDMGTYPISSINACKASGVTDVRTPGAAGTVNGTLISQIPGFPTDSFIPNPAAGRQFVSTRISQGADYIKVFLDPLGPDEETLAAIVQAAHAAGKQVITHATTYDDYSKAEAAGADFPCHVPLDKAIDSASVSNLVSGKQTVVPTLIMMQSIVNNTHAPYEAYLYNAQGSVTNMYKGKVPILVGTDANANPYVPANPPFGISFHQELQLLVQAGVSPVDAIKGATSTAASKFKLYDRGSILPGLRADLVLLSADPTVNIQNSLSIQRVWVNGVEFDPST
ncbi:amidohydrolase [Mariannaea sp. PMI_226]|nr:amidohydrolase [Mariannaea sp. PMI_226]